MQYVPWPGKHHCVVCGFCSDLHFFDRQKKGKYHLEYLSGDVGFNYNISEFYHAWIKMSIWIKDKIEKNEKSQHGKFLKHLQSFSDEDFTLL